MNYLPALTSLQRNMHFTENVLRQGSLKDFEAPKAWRGKHLYISDKAWLVDQRRLKTVPRGSLEFASLSLLVNIMDDYGPRNVPFCLADDLFHSIRSSDYYSLVERLKWLRSRGYIHFRK